MHFNMYKFVFGSAHSRLGASLLGEASEERAHVDLSFSFSYVGKSLPYKKTQLSLNYQCGSKFLISSFARHMNGPIRISAKFS